MTKDGVLEEERKKFRKTPPFQQIISNEKREDRVEQKWIDEAKVFNSPGSRKI